MYYKILLLENESIDRNTARSAVFYIIIIIFNIKYLILINMDKLKEKYQKRLIMIEFMSPSIHQPIMIFLLVYKLVGQNSDIVFQQ